MLVELALLLSSQVVDPPASPGAIAANPIVSGDRILLTWVEPGRVRMSTLGRGWSDPITVVELSPGKTVEIEARTRLSLRVDGASALPEPAPLAPPPNPAPPARKARSKPAAAPSLSQSQPASTGARSADELINPWPAAR